MSKEREITGTTDKQRNSDFLSAESFEGRTRANPVEMKMLRGLILDGVINLDGKKENNVWAMALATKDGREVSLRLRGNATKRKILTAAAGTPSWKRINESGVTVLLYQTRDKSRSGGSTLAIGMDAIQVSTGKRLRYYDYQTNAGKKFAKEGPAENWEDLPQTKEGSR